MDADLLKLLHAPECYPGDVSEVEIVQTHLSVVCLVGDTAYKLKKPVRLPFVDFSTLENRRHFCEEEVRLNRRLCSWIYRGVRPIRRLTDGRLRLGADSDSGGEIIDFAVEMERLPENRMMNRLLVRNDVRVESVREIAERMARFHTEAERSDAVNEAGDPEKLRDFALANYAETRGFTGTLFDARLHAMLEDRTAADFDRIMPALRRRSAEGRIVDGHGDLHGRNICLSDPIAIYDCIEFNRDFRCGDTATENAFLVMDLGYLGHRELADEYLDAYIEAGDDKEQRELMPALVRYRLMVRGKVAAIAAAESELSETEHGEAIESARRHFFRVAASFVEEEGPWIVIACGLPGSGKSHGFAALADQAGWPCHSSDRIRKELAGVSSPDESLPESFYSTETSNRTYAELLKRVSGELARNRVPLADANFRGRRERAMAREIAAAAGARFAIVHIETPEAAIIDRLVARGTGPGSESDADVAVYRKLKAEFEAPTAAECDRLIRVAGDAPAAITVAAILAGLLD